MSGQGGARPGAGRPIGVGYGMQERQRVAMEALRELNAAGVTPLHIFAAMMRGDESITTQQFEAAKAAAPYMHPKLSAVTVDATVRRDITDYSDEELFAIAGASEDTGEEGIADEVEGEK